MKTGGLLCCLLATCFCLVEARYKVRRPLPPPPPLPQSIYTKPWPIGPRISTGNTVHIGGLSFPHNRIPYKPSNYRIRRPPMFNILPTNWKNQMPIRAAPNNHVMLPKRPPVKEFHTISKVPEFSPEYRPEPAILPPTHRGGMDDDKGPIHTIPAPNLSPADKPYGPEIHPEESSVHQRQYPEPNYNGNQGQPSVNNFGFATLGTSVQPQRPVTNPTPTQHQYEVTESNDIQKDFHTVQPAFITPDFDVGRFTTVINPDLQTNEVFLNHPHVPNPGLIATNLQFGPQANAPMHTNLHSSLHVAFPGSSPAQTPYVVGHQVPDLHVGHPAPAGPPLSATQLYDLLNSFPQKLSEQYTSGQQPQLQQHILQQQLGQLFQPTAVTSFTQPQMHSFNYDEQANKQQQKQQQVLLGQDYASGRVTAEYNLEPELNLDPRQTNGLRGNEEQAYTEVGAEQTENSIDYEEQNEPQRAQTTYFGKVANNGAISTQFYTTLPSREAAEKLAALAAAGHVNSHLIGQLRKQQHEHQDDQAMPPNHKEDEYRDQRPEDDSHYRGQQDQYDQGQYDPQHSYDQRREQYKTQIREQEQDQPFEKQRVPQNQYRRKPSERTEEKRPLRIMVPDDQEYVSDAQHQGETKDNVEYEDYENDEAETEDVRSTTSTVDVRTDYEQNPNAQFGTRLRAKTGK